MTALLFYFWFDYAKDTPKYSTIGLITPNVKYRTLEW